MKAMLRCALAALALMLPARAFAQWNANSGMFVYPDQVQRLGEIINIPQASGTSAATFPWSVDHPAPFSCASGCGVAQGGTLSGATGSLMLVNTNNLLTAPHVCGSHIFKHITTATDTQIVAASGSTNIYVCDYSFSFNGTGNLYLEKATSGTCATLTQIDQAWYGVANFAKTSVNPYYSGLNTGASAQLCVNTSAAITVDVSVNYDQY